MNSFAREKNCNEDQSYTISKPAEAVLHFLFQATCFHLILCASTDIYKSVQYPGPQQQCQLKLKD